MTNVSTFLPIVEKAWADNHPLVAAAARHNDELFVDVEVVSKQDGSVELEVIAESPSHNHYPHYFVEVSEDKEIMSVTLSPLDECETCQAEWQEDDNMIQYYRRGN